jgi:hypothetical protein
MVLIFSGFKVYFILRMVTDRICCLRTVSEAILIGSHETFARKLVGLIPLGLLHTLK